MWGQYIIMDCHGVTNKVSLWFLNLQPNRFQGVQLYYFHSHTTILCVIGQIIGGRGIMSRAYLGLFWLVVEYGNTVSGYIWCPICTDPTKKWSLDICIYCYMLFSKIRMGRTSWYIKYMPVSFIFSTARDSLSNKCNFYWNPCMVRKWINSKKCYTISVTPLVLN